MNLQRCFEILDLPPGASLEEAKEAYRDIVHVWHPDRFSHHPRLKLKAEKKMKEINLAFAGVNAFLAEAEKRERRTDRAARKRHHAGESGNHEPPPITAEVMAEAGTRLILNLWSLASRAVVHAVLGDTRQAGKGKPRGGARKGQGAGS
jgi:DnaJ-class molecular chaperone